MTATGNPGKDPSRWEQRYIESEIPWDTGEPDPYLIEAFASLKTSPRNVLEIGCGTGTNSIWLTQQGCAVVGLDLSPTAIQIAQDKATRAGANCQLIAGDFLTDTIPGSPFDLVYDRACFHIFDDAKDRARFAQRVSELLCDDGLWHCLLGSTDGPPRDTGPPRRSAQDIASAVEPFFEILSLNSTTFDQERHPGARAWTLIARRR